MCVRDFNAVTRTFLGIFAIWHAFYLFHDLTFYSGVRTCVKTVIFLLLNGKICVTSVQQQNVQNQLSKVRQMGSLFWDVMRHVENLPDRHTEEKSRFVVFSPKISLQIIWYDIMASKKCESDPSWSRFCVKICDIAFSTKKGPNFGKIKWALAGWCFEIKLIPLAKVQTTPGPRRKWFVFWKKLNFVPSWNFRKTSTWYKIKFFQKNKSFSSGPWGCLHFRQRN